MNGLHGVHLTLLLSALFLVGCGGGGGGSSSSSSGCLGETANIGESTIGASAVQVSGVIEIESQTRVDVDTADDLRLNQASSNNCDDEAQLLPVTGIVGGYLSAETGTYPFRAGDNAQFDFEADNQDYYAADFRPGDRVSLQVFSDSRVSQPQPRLQVFDSSNRAVFDSNDLATPQPFIHIIESPAGEHVIRVSAESGGPFRYVLIGADRNASSVMNTSYAEPEFVPGEAVVTASAGHTFGNSAKAMATALSAETARELRPGVWHLRRPVFQSMSMTVNARSETMDWIRQLQTQPDVVSASPNYLYRVQSLSPATNPLYNRQWHYPLINLPVAWQAAPRAGSGVGVAVLDTGLFSSSPNTIGNWHPDLQDNVLTIGGQILDYVSSDNDLDNQPGRDQNPADPGDGQTSSSFHGTHVAGIVAGVDNSEGGVGVANQSDLIPVRVLGEGGTGSLSDLIDAIAWAASRPEIDVINLSLGGVGPNDQLEDAINAAHNAGKLVVAAAGNQRTDEATFPAAFDNVVGVGAVDGAGVRASYSNVGPSVDLVAPGGDAGRDANLDNSADLVLSTWGSDDDGVFEPRYNLLQGTSMAAPHVSGVFALMKAENAALDAEDFFALLLAGELTDVVGQEFEYGAGLINAVKSVDAALNGAIPAVLASSPPVVALNLANNQQELSLNRYPSGADFVVTGIDSGENWLELGEELQIGSPPPSSITVSLNEALLEQAENDTAELRIDYQGDGSDRTLSISVNARLIDPGDERNAGRHYVLLVSDDESRSTGYQTVATANGGQYSFEFGDVEPGSYFLVAGTDIDNNGLICESGEACAEYPVNGLPQPLQIGDESLSSLRMSTSFQRPAISSLGGPRIGFKGYRLRTVPAGDEPVRRRSAEP
ncbi:hypothetical protein DYI22_08795 [Marinobacter lipolyticus]|nr:hypothetical protein [Marinobacter lipolyticus]